MAQGEKAHQPDTCHLPTHTTSAHPPPRTACLWQTVNLLEGELGEAKGRIRELERALLRATAPTAAAAPAAPAAPAAASAAIAGPLVVCEACLPTAPGTAAPNAAAVARSPPDPAPLRFEPQRLCHLPHAAASATSHMPSPSPPTPPSAACSTVWQPRRATALPVPVTPPSGARSMVSSQPGCTSTPPRETSRGTSRAAPTRPPSYPVYDDRTLRRLDEMLRLSPVRLVSTGPRRVTNTR